MYQNYDIPLIALSTPTPYDDILFILLNNEFRNATNVFGFEILADIDGDITIRVRFFKFFL